MKRCEVPILIVLFAVTSLLLLWAGTYVTDFFVQVREYVGRVGYVVGILVLCILAVFLTRERE